MSELAETFETAQTKAHQCYNHNVKLRARLLQRVESLAAAIDSAIAVPAGVTGPDGRGWPIVERYLNEMRLLFDLMARLIQEVHRLAQERNVLKFGLADKTLSLKLDDLSLVVPARRVENLEDLVSNKEG